jgi:outer membrane lipoprotein SlyB
MTHVAGVFHNQTDANQAINQLIKAGFNQSDISLLVSEKAKTSLFSSGSASSTNDTDNKAVRGGVAGALLGGVLGALIGGLVAVGSIAIPGSDLLATGPIVAALSGAGAGAATGGLAGALINAGFSSYEAKRYEDEIQRGNVVVTLDISENRVNEARHILLRSEGSTKVA